MRSIEVAVTIMYMYDVQITTRKLILYLQVHESLLHFGRLNKDGKRSQNRSRAALYLSIARSRQNVQTFRVLHSEYGCSGSSCTESLIRNHSESTPSAEEHSERARHCLEVLN